MILLAAVLAGTCIPVEGELIVAAELARAVPVFSALSPEQPVGYAPVPGARRIFSGGELARLAARHGLELKPPSGVCFERVVERLAEERVLGALRAALANDAAQLRLLDFSRYAVPRGDLEFPRSGLAAPSPVNPGLPVLWRGRIRYAGSRSMPVWARVKIAVRGKRAVAAEDLPAGRPIQASQVRIEEAELCPLAELPADSIDQVAGRVLRRSIRKNTPLSPGMLSAPAAVERGQTVEVEVASGAAQLRLQARAESGGNAGDVVVLRNPGNGRRFPARVEGQGKVSVDAKHNLPLGTAVRRAGRPDSR